MQLSFSYNTSFRHKIIWLVILTFLLVYILIVWSVHLWGMCDFKWKKQEYPANPITGRVKTMALCAVIFSTNKASVFQIPYSFDKDCNEKRKIAYHESSSMTFLCNNSGKWWYLSIFSDNLEIIIAWSPSVLLSLSQAFSRNIWIFGLLCEAMHNRVHWFSSIDN